jgi:(1->4)-alpha-D-glucan 1-alpha-D-glucosylmutase
VLLPLLGRPYHEALAAGEIELKFDPAEGSFSAWYFEHRLPIAPQCYATILRKVVAREEATRPAGQQLLDLAGRKIVTRENADTLKRELASTAATVDVLSQGLRAYRPDPNDPIPARSLHRLLERQHYRIAHWRLASSEINYRRFFDINSLAALRVEHPATFDAIHRRVLRLISDNQLQGLRLDHIDGLWDPDRYCDRLQQAISTARGSSEPFYIVVEKILEPDEPPPAFPGIFGTTGYEWLNVITQALIDGEGLAPLTRTWCDASGETRPFTAIVMEAKRYVIGNLLASEFTTLANLLTRIAAGHCSTRDFAPTRLRAALELYVLNFPVYRTYVTPERCSAADRRFIEHTIAAARREWHGPDDGIFEFLRAILTLEAIVPGRSTHSRRHARQFVGKLQQFTGPLMAKSLEDTAFYRYHAVLALTEVGGRPDAPALTIDSFHKRMHARASKAPHGLTATATHDTKRGEDARARLMALTELPDEWRALVQDWRRFTARLISEVRGTRVPSAAHEYLFYQALLGGWPLGVPDQSFTERVQAFLRKAAREGKQQTSWLDPDSDYERGLADFVAAALDPARSDAFLKSFTPFAQRIARLGALNSLSQLTLKLTVPGVPDIYQGTELWDLSFVDPDNRRPVDFPARAELLDRLVAERNWSSLTDTWQSGDIKLALLHHLLEIRREYAELFATGDYGPITVRGAHAARVVAFTRSDRRDAIVVALGRCFAPLTDGGRRWPRATDWQGEIVLDGYEAIEALGPSRALPRGNRLDLSKLFDPLPIALLRATHTK